MSDDGQLIHLWPSAEQRLLLGAALREDAGALECFNVWRRDLDLAGDFGYQNLRLLPLVYENLLRRGLRDPLMARLKGVYRRSWCETQRLFHLTRPVVAALVAHGIPVTLLKGAPLALDYYRNSAVRPMADVDIAIAPSDMSRALELLRSMGWRTTSEVTSDTLRFRHAVQCLGPEGGEIDLHWHVMYEAATDDADRFFDRAAEPLDFLGIPVRQLDPTGLLLLVILHGLRWNDETPVRWIPDALTILRRRGHDIAWERLVDFAQMHRLTHRLGLGLGYLTDHYGAAIPAEVTSALRSAALSLVERFERSVLLADNRPLEASARGTQWVYFVEYCRFANTKSPIAFVNGFTHYLRYFMGLGSRREMLPLLAGGVRKRLLGSGTAPVRSSR